jgi:hypothetical protein
MLPPGHLGQVAAVAAADVNDALGPGQADDQLGQVKRRLLVGVDRLPGGQVGIGPVLGLGQDGPVSP